MGKTVCARLTVSWFLFEADEVTEAVEARTSCACSRPSS